MIINGHDLATDGFVTIELSGWLSPPAWQRGTTALPDVFGVAPNLRTTVGPRTIKMAVRTYCTSLADRQTKLMLLQDRLTGLLHVRFDDWPNRIVRCVAGAIAVSSVDKGGAFAVPTLEVAFDLTAYDGAS